MGSAVSMNSGQLDECAVRESWSHRSQSQCGVEKNARHSKSTANIRLWVGKVAKEGDGCRYQMNVEAAGSSS